MLAGSIAASKLAGSIGNSKLSNSSITVSDGSNTSPIALGGTLTFAGTSGEVDSHLSQRSDGELSDSETDLDEDGFPIVEDPPIVGDGDVTPRVSLNR